MLEQIIFWGILTVCVALIITLIILWLRASILKVEVWESGVKVILGRPVEVLRPGIYFIPWFFKFNSLVKVPSQQFVVPIEELVVYSKADEEYGRQRIRVRLAVRLRFPRKGQFMEINGQKVERLIEVVRSNIPLTTEGLSEYLKAPVQEAARVVMGRYTYGYAAERVKEIQEEADEILHRPESVLSKAGFPKEDYQLIISEIFLEKKIEEAMAEVDERKYRAEAASHLARARARETMQTLINLLAVARGKTEKEIQQEINEHPELRKRFEEIALDLTHRKMAIDAGTFFDIRVPHGTSLEALLTLAKQKLFSGRVLSDRREEKKDRDNEPPPDFSVRDIKIK